MVEGSEFEGAGQNDLGDMPADDPEKYFAWLKEFHDERRILGLPEDEIQPRIYDYQGVTLQEVEKVLTALKTQRPDDPEGLRSLLEDLNPAQIILLADDPSRKLYLPGEIEELEKKRLEAEIQRISKMPDVLELAQPLKTGFRYVHATAVPETAVEIGQSGLLCHENGLAGVAVPLSRQDEQYNLKTMAFRHRGHENLVVVNLPDIPPDLIEKLRTARTPLGRVTLDGLFAEEIPKEKRVDKGGAGISYDALIPAKYVEGVLNARTGTFNKNPEFNPALTPVDISRLNTKLDSIAKSTPPTFRINR